MPREDEAAPDVEIRKAPLSLQIVIVLRLIGTVEPRSRINRLAEGVATHEGEPVGEPPFHAHDQGVVVRVNIRSANELIRAGLRVVTSPFVRQIRDALVLQSTAGKFVPVGSGIAHRKNGVGGDFMVGRQTPFVYIAVAEVGWRRDGGWLLVAKRVAKLISEHGRGISSGRRLPLRKICTCRVRKGIL